MKDSGLGNWSKIQKVFWKQRKHTSYAYCSSNCVWRELADPEDHLFFSCLYNEE